MKNNKLKFISILCLLFCIAIFSISASKNSQRIISVKDQNNIISSLEVLCIESGLALPSMSAPYSVAEIKNILNRIEIENLNEYSLKSYKYLIDILDSYSFENDKDVGFDFIPSVNLEAYYHLDEKNFIERDSWIRGWNDQKPLFNLETSFFVNDLAYGFAKYSIETSKHFCGDLEFGGKRFSTNIPGLEPSSLKDFNANTSDRAFLAFGGDNWSIQVGRDQLNWGAGVTGNLFLSDNLKYQNMARFSFFGDSFKYSYVASFFPHQINYSTIIENGEEREQYPNKGQWTKLKGFSMFSAHRIEGTLFNRLGWAISEGIMFADEDGNIEMNAFNPMLSYHSLFLKKNCNSLLSLDLDFTIAKSFNIYSQIVIDDLVIPVVESKETSWSPNSVGAIIGLRYAMAHKFHQNLISFEFAYTTPYLYLRNDGSSIGEKKLDSNGDEYIYDGVQNGYGINFVVALREFDNTGIFYDKQFLGYKYGGDALIFNMNNKMFSTNLWNFEMNYFLMCHGSFDINTNWSFVGPDAEREDIDTIISIKNPENSSKTIPSVTNVLGFNFAINPINQISLYSQLDFVGIFNYNNVPDINVFDIQITAGISLSV